MKLNFYLDKILLLLVFCLSLFGLVIIYDASVVEAEQLFGDKFYFLKAQAIWWIIGWIGLLISIFIPLEWLKKILPFLFSLTLIFLILVLLPGFSEEILGAKRWLKLGSIRFQPSELAKPVLILYLSSWLEKSRSIKQFLVLIGLLGFLIMLQPDLGTTVIIIASAFFLYYLSGASIKSIISIGIMIITIGSLIIWVSPYRRARFLTFMNPSSDPLGSSYHVRQALIAIGSGGFWGVGLGQSRQKFQYLPQVTTDSIFAVIAEETGIIGASLTLVTFWFIVLRGYKIAKNSQDQFRFLTASGISSWLGLQSIVNIAAMVALIPLTGVPLPFLSYGGSSLVINLFSIGLLLNISRVGKIPLYNR